MSSVKFKNRPCDVQIEQAAQQQGLDEVISRIIAQRVDCHELPQLDAILNPTLRQVAPPDLLLGQEAASMRLVEAIVKKQTIGILTDYDVDGITSHALIYLALTEHFQVDKSLISHHIGHRIEDGYGISDALTNRILADDQQPQVIISADCGSSDHARITRLKQGGIDVIVTDHHAIPEQGVPQDAFATVNPTQINCSYPDASIAGCQVAWLVMSGVRNALVEAKHLPQNAPKLADLLDFVALGTVADAVSLKSTINRAVVRTGLALLNRRLRPAWQAMAIQLNKPTQAFDADDLGFQLGPRINARSRMADPYAALYYLLAPDLSTAQHYLAMLDEDNQNRKDTEKNMLIVAKAMAKEQVEQGLSGLVLSHDDFHLGVQGIVASRIVEQFGRPCVVMTQSTQPGAMTGSARTIERVHVRDVLQAVSDENPAIFKGFGGHKGAAGLTIDEGQLASFKTLFDQKVKAQVGGITLGPEILTDGALLPNQISLRMLDKINQLKPFGRGFMAPIFEGQFKIDQFRWIGKPAVHLALQCHMGNQTYKAIWFFAKAEPQDDFPHQPGDELQLAYRMNANHYRNNTTLQLHIVGVGQKGGG